MDMPSSGRPQPVVANTRPPSHGSEAVEPEGTVGDVLAAIRDAGQLVFVKPGQALFSAGDAADGVFVVVSGLVRTCIMLPDGRRQILGFHEAGDLLGVTLAEHHSHSAEAVSSAKLQSVSRIWLQSLLVLQPHLCLSLIPPASHSIEAARRHLVLLGRMTARERLCTFLLERLMGEVGTITLPMSRLDIADYLGLTIETVSRTVTQLRMEGVIHTTTAHIVEVADRRELVECLEASRRDRNPLLLQVESEEPLRGKLVASRRRHGAEMTRALR
jgi:CRP/FNR family transcriptional regulator